MKTPREFALRLGEVIDYDNRDGAVDEAERAIEARDDEWRTELAGLREALVADEASWMVVAAVDVLDECPWCAGDHEPDCPVATALSALQRIRQALAPHDIPATVTGEAPSSQPSRMDTAPGGGGEPGTTTEKVIDLLEALKAALAPQDPPKEDDRG